MEWLSPATGLLAAAVAVPLLVALYFLKLKRRDEAVPSTLLWKRAVQDLQVNAPFRMLRRNILLILQLLALAALLVALARPALRQADVSGNRCVILLDCSASMSATDEGPSRLAEAKRQAKALVAALRDRPTWSFSGESDRAMVVAFDRRARVVCNYTADHAQLNAAIDSVEPTDGPSYVREAVDIARAFATSAGPETNNRSAETPARLHVFTDGRVADLDDVAVGRGELVYHRIGTTGDNLALVAMQTRRPYDHPEQLEVFVVAANYGAEPVESDLQMSINGNVRAVRAVEVPGRVRTEGQGDRPGQTSVAFTLTNAEPGVLEVRLLRADALPNDNVAWAVLQAPRQLRVLLVTPGNAPLEAALKACALARLEVKSLEEFEQLDADLLTAERPWHVIVLDRCQGTKLPVANYLVFGPPPASLELPVQGELEAQRIIDWRPRHPVLSYVNLDNLYASGVAKIEPPRDVAVLAEFEDAPALLFLQRPTGKFLVAPFNVLESNWPFDAGFVMFCYNTIVFLGTELGDGQLATLKVGQPIIAQTGGRAAEVEVLGPAGGADHVTSDAAGELNYGRTWQAGIYRLTAAGADGQFFAVNLLDPAESDLAPAAELAVMGQSVEARAAERALTNRELWPPLAALGLLVVLVEWWVYNAKVRI